MVDETPHRRVRRVRDEDLEGWQRDLVEESPRRSREEKVLADRARREAAAQCSRETPGSGSDEPEDG